MWLLGYIMYCIYPCISIQRLAAEGILSSGLSIYCHMLKICEHDILQTLVGISRGALVDKDELIRCWGQEIKGQHHDETKHGQ